MARLTDGRLNPDVRLGYAVLRRVRSGRLGEARRPART
ncbi:unnamed protein product [[Actinomadura] parvosata subsp. kistnae]|nr:unnamed protein product [Actinomadura parvosata subsp. kistnae]